MTKTGKFSKQRVRMAIAAAEFFYGARCRFVEKR